ncbi:hypothetical protein LMG31506_02998 [Cupriavidus yeoncheonensis]|uniref:Uncharacterized protein n=1 Tax=Cupriavidus yeoncheonensis TaxID=1462994 RepID=A0A916MVM4_9BURK|nr:hypothetical protein [Cupriavidus yeoncheonensis]CAG2144403.1 hypothetical protein LMG31506_02998 [Cupriavidus yeoncheonensis]
MSLAEKNTQFAADVDIAHQIVHGPASGAGSTVTTDGGPVRSLAKLVADKDADINSAANGVLANATAQATAASGSAATATTQAGNASASASAAAASAADAGNGVSGIRADFSSATDPAKGAALMGFEGGTARDAFNGVYHGLIDLRKFGAKFDAAHALSGGAISSGSAVFTDASAAFTQADVGKLFYVVGAGVGGKLLSTTIASRQSATQVTLANAASVTVASAEYIYGTDDTAAWQSAAASVNNGVPCSFHVPFGLSITDGIAVKNNTSFIGLQGDGWAFQNTKRASGIILKPQSAAPAQVYGTSASVGNVQLKNLLLDGAYRFQGNTVHRYSGGAISVGSKTFTDSANGNFTSADIGKKIAIYGAGSNGNNVPGACFVSTIQSVTNATTVVLEDNHPPSITVASAAYSYGFSTQQGKDGATTASSAVFTSASANFTSADIGRRMDIYGAALPQWGTGADSSHGDAVGSIISTTIASINSTTSVNLAINADLTLMNAQWRLGCVDAIWQPHSAVSQDSMWDIERVVAKNYSGNGWTVGALQRANRADRFYVWQTLCQGIALYSSDNNLQRCMTAQCGEDGLYGNQSTNHVFGLDTFNNNGNGVFLSPYAQMWSFASCSIDNNEKNGMLDFAKGTMRFGVRFTSNSQCQNGLYSDLSVCRRYIGGPSNQNQWGTSLLGCFWAYASSLGFKPAYGVEAVGPFQIAGTGVQYDASATFPWVTNSISSGSITTLHQTSFSIQSGTNINLGGNNNFIGSTSMGTKLGNAANELWGFYGATPIVRPTGTPAAATDAATTQSLVNSLRASLIALGLVS